MDVKKEKPKKTSFTDRAVLQARGETLIVLGAIIIGISLLLCVYELAMGRSIFGFLSITMAYLTGASLYSYRYQKTRGFLIFGIAGALLTILCLGLYWFL